MNKCEIVNGVTIYCDDYLIMFEAMPKTLSRLSVCPCCGEVIKK